jgi:hypothetical protein
MQRGIMMAIIVALCGPPVACAIPEPTHPVRTETEAIAAARTALAEIGYGKALLTAERDDKIWIISTPRKYDGPNWDQMIVRVDAQTGKVALGSFESINTDIDIRKPSR